jgi:hypothetical protein
MILQENGYALIQEGEHQYGLLQEIRWANQEKYQNYN